jgi:putative ABC transport system permease protein
VTLEDVVLFSRISGYVARVGALVIAVPAAVTAATNVHRLCLLLGVAIRALQSGAYSRSALSAAGFDPTRVQLALAAIALATVGLAYLLIASVLILKRGSVRFFDQLLIVCIFLIGGLTIANYPQPINAVAGVMVLAGIGLVFLVVSIGIVLNRGAIFQVSGVLLTIIWLYVGLREILAADLPLDDGGLHALLGASFPLGQAVWLVLGDVVLEARRLIPSHPPGLGPYLFMIWVGVAGITLLALIAEQREFIQLAFKQMRQRALSTTMTIVLVLLGVGLAIAVMIVRRESESLFGQSDFGYEFILGPPKASATQLVFNTVYNIDVSPGNIPYRIYEEMMDSPKYHSGVRWAIPILVGDTYQGRGDRRIVGTSPQMFGYRDDGTLIPITDESHPFEYRYGKMYELGESKDVDKDGILIPPRMFRPRKFEAVLGSEVAAKDGFHLYDDKLTEEQNVARHAVFQATHGMPPPNETPDIHKPKWHVVGVLKPTHTASDRVLYVPVISLYAIEEHEIGEIAQKLIKGGYTEPYSLPPDKAEEIMRKVGINPDELSDAARKKFHLPTKGAAPPPPPPKPASGGELLTDKPEPAVKAPATAPAAADEDVDAYHFDEKGELVPDLPKQAWELSAILIKTRGGFRATQLMYNFRVAAPDFIAANPASVMRDFFNTFFKPSTYVLLGISLLVTIVAAGSIVVGIYNSVAARMREIAILRALGATKKKVLTLICVEAGLIGFFGAILGLITGHGLGAFGSYLANAKLGQSINWLRVGWNEDWYANELLYLLTVVVVAVFAGLVPALKAYRTSVATNLSAG